eukprot:TRINITY_DN8065_c0_g1_i1.p1 TRINITY_DN8065_c0_g1~~TRINITY_DN8065_c0_g1_i1.p1  ORF type:complete len:450 (+),score=85.17 TRINITY_DN8065_c0_g1_i1:73-1422(+)
MMLPELDCGYQEDARGSFEYLRKHSRKVCPSPASHRFELMRNSIPARDRKGIGSLIVAQDMTGNAMKRLPPAIHHYKYEVDKLETEQAMLQQHQLQRVSNAPAIPQFHLTPPHLINQPAPSTPKCRSASTISDLIKALAQAKVQKRKKRKKKRKKATGVPRKQSSDLRQIQCWFAKMKKEADNRTCPDTVMAKELWTSENELEAFRSTLQQIIAAPTCRFSSELRRISQEYEKHITLLTSTVVSLHCKQESLQYCNDDVSKEARNQSSKQRANEAAPKKAEKGCDPIIPQRTALGDVMMNYSGGSTHIPDRIACGTARSSVHHLDETICDSESSESSSTDTEVPVLRERVAELEMVNHVFLDSLQSRETEIHDLKKQLATSEASDLLAELDSRDKLIEQHQSIADEARQNWVQEKCTSEQLKMEVSNLNAELETYQNEIKRLKAAATKS